MAGYSQLLICLALVGLTGETLSGGTLDAFTTSNCTVNGVSVPCGPGAMGPPGASVFVNPIDLGTPGIDVIAVANALVDSTSGITSANASVRVDFFATTAGPVRQGSISYGVGGDGDGSGGGGGGGSASIAGVVSCSGSSGSGPCVIQHTGVPFLLGVPFEVIVTANASAPPGSPDLAGGSGNGEVRVSLFDMSGNPVTIIAPVPEPRHLGITALALMGAAVLFRKRA